MKAVSRAQVSAAHSALLSLRTEDTAHDCLFGRIPFHIQPRCYSCLRHWAHTAQDTAPTATHELPFSACADRMRNVTTYSQPFRRFIERKPDGAFGCALRCVTNAFFFALQAPWASLGATAGSCKMICLRRGALNPLSRWPFSACSSGNYCALTARPCGAACGPASALRVRCARNTKSAAPH